MTDATIGSAVTTAARVGPVRARRGAGVKALVVAHIILSVGLLGDSAGFLAVAVRRATSADAEFRSAARELLAMFALGFGIPLSLLALLTGVTLALVTRWGVFRFPWTLAKLTLILSVIVVGATVISPVLNPAASVDDGALVAGAIWDVVALAAATTLAVFRPGKAIRRRKESPHE